MRDILCRVMLLTCLVSCAAGCSSKSSGGGGSGGGDGAATAKTCATLASPCPDNSSCSETPTGPTCVCRAGFSQQGKACQDIDECAKPTACPSGQKCTNTPGGFTCAAAACGPPKTVCGPLCVDTTSDQDHCGSCETACGGDRSCVNSICVGEGNLEISATWNRPGDADLLVRTPSGKVIWLHNRGPDDNTDNGQLDREDSKGTGPENVYWFKLFTPPSGTYALCLATPSFDPPPSAGNPVTYTVLVQRPSKDPQTFTGAVKAPLATGVCDSTQPSYVGSITYP